MRQLATVRLAPGATLAGYRIEEELGEGGMGVVYRATQVALERPVALKLIAPELAADLAFRERFRREAKLAASIEHPNVLPVHEAGEVDGVLFVSVRLVEGCDAAELLREGPLEPARALAFVCDVAAALDAAHARGLVHRDVKPHNILVERRGDIECAYLTDFGLAKLSAGESKLTATGVLVGTVDYAAPEVIRGEAVDGRADVYSLGCLLYEFLTGEVPFPREHHVARLWAHVHDEPPSVSDRRPGLPSAVDDVVRRALAKQAGDRFATAGELADAAARGLTDGSETHEAEPRSVPDVARRTEGNLPVAPTPLIGRRHELATVRELLSKSRLVTLTGAGGSGKTRLALQAADDMAGEYPDGAWWVSLAPLRDSELVELTIAQAVGAKGALSEHLRQRSALLLLDNFEHLLDAAGVVSRLLEEAPNVAVLATSRERLGIAAEQEYGVPPLTEPESVALFIARARRLQPQFEPDGDVVELCRRLDGLPLALELAAARVKAMRSSEILERLGHSLDLLIGGARDAPERQRTLRATVEWSHDLLSGEERQLFARLSVFSGGCTLDAAEQVVQADLDTLQSLVEKSLLRHTGARYWMLETIREFAEERLNATERASAFRDHHLQHFLALAEEAEVGMKTADQERWLATVSDEKANLRSAIDWAGDHDHTLALRLCSALAWFWHHGSDVQEGRRRLAFALERSGDSPVRLRASALDGACVVCHACGDFAAERTYATEQLRLADELADPAARARALSNMALAIAAGESDLDSALGLLRESVDLARTAGDDWVLAISTLNLGWVALANHDYEFAIQALDESLALSRAQGDRVIRMHILFNLGQAHLKAGDPHRAAAIFDECLQMSRDVGFADGLVYCLVGLAGVAVHQGEAERAARLLGAAEAGRAELGIGFEPGDQEMFDEIAASVVALLGDDAAEAEVQAGRGMHLDRAVDYARSPRGGPVALLASGIEGSTQPAARKGNLPVPPTPLIGRQKELADVRALLSESRLVTLTGAGGAGKTRLALQVAEDLADEFAYGVWWISLAALQDPELVEPTIAEALGAKDGVAERLRGLRALLLLDNFEHLLDAAPAIAGLLSEAAEIRVLATSRERLGVAAEQEYRVPPLAPADALELFTARARRVQPDYVPDELVADICRRLDGLPLAIELAAARVTVLASQQILDRLAQRFDLLTAGNRDAPARHQTLRATIEWSHELLDESERQLFARLAVFAGSFSLEAAEAVCGAALDTLQALVDKSLLRSVDGGRFFMLETIREYAAERFAALLDADSLTSQLVVFFVQLAERAEHSLGTHDERDWLDELDRERINLTFAAERALAMGRGDDARRLLGALWRFFEARTNLREARDLLGRALAADVGDPAVRAKALFASARLAFRESAYEEARPLLEEGLALYERVGSRAGVASCLAGLGWVEGTIGSPRRALELCERAVAEARASGEASVIADALNNLGCMLAEERELAAARQAHDEALELRIRIGDGDGIAASYGNLGEVARAEGTNEEAAEHFERLTEVAVARGDRWLEAMALLGAAEITAEQGQLELAADRCAQAEALAHEFGYPGVHEQIGELASRYGLKVVAPTLD